MDCGLLFGIDMVHPPRDRLELNFRLLHAEAVESPDNWWDDVNGLTDPEQVFA